MILTKEVLGKYREFAKQINPKVKIVKGTDWCCYSDTLEIEVPQLVPDNSISDFMITVEKQLDKIGKKYLLDIYDDFIWCFMHEMGHLCKPKKYHDRFIRNTLDKISQLGFTSISKFFYYRLKEEKTATIWACNYVNQNQKLISKYNLEIVRRYKKFYKSMNIKEVIQKNE